MADKHEKPEAISPVEKAALPAKKTDDPLPAETISPAKRSTSSRASSTSNFEKEYPSNGKGQPGVSVAEDNEKGADSNRNSNRYVVNWPKEEGLVVSGFAKFVLNLYDFFLVICPILFIVKIGGVISVDGRGANDFFADVMLKLNKQLVTFYTIIFVMIVATFMRRLALFRAQRGEYVHNLEQLQASISMTSALKSVWSLRAFTIQSLGILALWSFYYIGSQAVERELTHNAKPIRGMNTTAYHASSLTRALETNAQGQPNAVFNASFAYSFPELIPYIFNSALLDHVNNPYYPDDNFKNTRVPMIETAVVQPDVDGWHYIADPTIMGTSSWTQQAYDYIEGYLRDPKGPDTVSPAGESSLESGGNFEGDFTHSHPSHASFVGVPAYIPPDYDWIVYNLNTSYFHFDCTQFTSVALSSLPTGPSNQPNGSSSNIASGSAVLFMKLDDATMQNRSKTKNYHDPTPLTLYLRRDKTGFQSQCSVVQTFVQVFVECQFSYCEPLKVRYDEYNMNKYQGKTALDVPESMVAKAMTDLFPFASGITTNSFDHLGILESYLDLQRVQPLATVAAFRRTPDWASISARNVSVRLTQLVNSYLQIAMSPDDVILSLDNSVTLDQFTSLDRHNDFTQVPCQTLKEDTSYRILIAWIVLDISTCFILFAIAIASWVLRVKTLAPDIFGYVSSLTRENPHLAIPEGGTRLNGFERARLMKTVKVRIGDVHQHQDGEAVGRIGFAAADEDEVHRVARLDAAKRYL